MNTTVSQSNKPWIIGITGASGTAYGRRLVQALFEYVSGIHLEVIISEAALRVMREEEGLKVSRHSKAEQVFGFSSPSLTLHDNRNIGASIASGSYLTSGMVIVPCSMATISAVAHGFATTLIHRAADVVLKEKRKLVLVPRETPFSVIHLENLLRLAQVGAAIVPAMPGFYHQPKTINEIMDLMVMRILDQMGFEIDLTTRWSSRTREEKASQDQREILIVH